MTSTPSGPPPAAPALSVEDLRFHDLRLRAAGRDPVPVEVEEKRPAAEEARP